MRIRMLQQMLHKMIMSPLPEFIIEIDIISHGGMIPIASTIKQ